MLEADGGVLKRTIQTEDQNLPRKPLPFPRCPARKFLLIDCEVFAEHEAEWQYILLSLGVGQALIVHR